FSYELPCISRDLHSFPTRRSSDLHRRQNGRRRFAVRRPQRRHVDRRQAGVRRGFSRPVQLTEFTYQRIAPATASHTAAAAIDNRDRKSTRLNSSHVKISYAVFCLK